MNKSNRLKNDNWYGISKKEIKWYPTIDYNKCIGCGLCILDCPVFVFSYDFEHHSAKVIKAQKCVVGCEICVNLCIPKAINLPPVSYLNDIMKERDVFTEVWKKLESNKYMYM